MHTTTTGWILGRMRDLAAAVQQYDVVDVQITFCIHICMTL